MSGVMKALKHLLPALAITGLVGLGSVSNSHAQDIRILGEFQDWTAQAFKEGSRTTCFISTAPKAYTPKDKNRHGDVQLFVTHFPGNDVKGEVSVIVGYNWSPGSKVMAKIGSTSYEMFTQDRTAWMVNNSLQPALIADMRKGVSLYMNGKSRRGTQTKYTFSLRGFSKALTTINQACGVS